MVKSAEKLDVISESINLDSITYFFYCPKIT
jgi:hypothetical protein